MGLLSRFLALSTSAVGYLEILFTISIVWIFVIGLLLLVGFCFLRILHMLNFVKCFVIIAIDTTM